MTNYNPFSLEGKTILVTGASSGIGKAIAIECSKMGATVVITGRNAHRLTETFDQLEGSDNIQIVADLSIENSIENLIEQTPSINGLVNCAGISGHKLFKFISDSYVRDMFDINFFSATFLTHQLLKFNKISKDGSIIFMTSTSGIVSSYIGGAIYSATKGALGGLIKGLALDLAPKRIRVNSIMPAMVETPIMEGGDVDDIQLEEDRKKYPLKRYGKPEEVAYAAIYLLSNASAWTTGSNLLLDGGRTISY
ncbi:MAG: SDR family oxidoreductase [Muribaculaceae bacterium]